MTEITTNQPLGTQTHALICQNELFITWIKEHLLLFFQMANSA